MAVELGAIVSFPMLTNPEAEFGRTILHLLVETVELCEMGANDVMMLVLSEMVKETGMITK